MSLPFWKTESLQHVISGFFLHLGPSILSLATAKAIPPPSRPGFSRPCSFWVLNISVLLPMLESRFSLLSTSAKQRWPSGPWQVQLLSLGLPDHSNPSRPLSFSETLPDVYCFCHLIIHGSMLLLGFVSVFPRGLKYVGVERSLWYFP